MDISNIQDKELLREIGRRFDEKSSSISEMEFLTKKLLDLNEKHKKDQAVKSQFLSLIKNEFNNPMSSLLNVANMLSGTQDLKKINTLGDLLFTELLNLDFSLKNIFCASEIEAGETANEYSTLAIEELFKDATEYLSILIKEKELKVTIDNPKHRELHSDSQKIYMIILNLLSNACEFSYKTNEVKLTIEYGHETFKIIVENEGEKILSENTQQIYNRFVHFETGETRESAGLGLGLSVSKGMAESLDGTIENHTNGKITQFVATIPYIDESELELSTAFGANEFMFDDNISNEMVEF